ncbi:unnamed protein product [Amoebophrya sp. A120]|nr:unnamed protein product [Amoebophrya sp. A120]|eukprot:GSA120T00000381001.1
MAPGAATAASSLMQTMRTAARGFRPSGGQKSAAYAYLSHGGLHRSNGASAFRSHVSGTKEGGASCADVVPGRFTCRRNFGTASGRASAAGTSRSLHFFPTRRDWSGHTCQTVLPMRLPTTTTSTRAKLFHQGAARSEHHRGHGVLARHPSQTAPTGDAAHQARSLLTSAGAAPDTTTARIDGRPFVDTFWGRKNLNLLSAPDHVNIIRKYAADVENIAAEQAFDLHKSAVRVPQTAPVMVPCSSTCSGRIRTKQLSPGAATSGGVFATPRMQLFQKSQRTSATSLFASGYLTATSCSPTPMTSRSFSSTASSSPAASGSSTSPQTKVNTNEYGIQPTKRKKPSAIDVHRRAVPAPPREAAPFQEVGSANEAASNLVNLLVMRDTSNNPFRLFFGLAFGYLTGFVAHSFMGIFDVLCVFSTTFGCLGYLFVVGSNFSPLFYFFTAPLVLFLGTPYWDQYFGLGNVEEEKVPRPRHREKY